MMEWKLAEAKNRLSELVTKATTEGPQTIRRHGQAVVVLAERTYQALLGERPTFKDWILKGPRIDDLDLPSRNSSPMRDVKL
jgi:prevent-host-death family protein